MSEVLIQDSAIIMSKLCGGGTSGPFPALATGQVDASTSNTTTTTRQRSQSNSAGSKNNNSGRKKKSPRHKRRSNTNNNNGRSPGRNRSNSRSSAAGNENNIDGHQNTNNNQHSISPQMARRNRPQQQKHIQFGPVIPMSVSPASSNRFGSMNRIISNSQLYHQSNAGGGVAQRRIRQRSRSMSDTISVVDLNTVVANLSGRNRGQQNQNLVMKPGMSNEYVCREIMDYYQRNRQSNDKYKAKQILRQSLENTLKQSFPSYFVNLHVIGSSTNGIGDNASTIDICILARKKLMMPPPSTTAATTPVDSPVKSAVNGEESVGDSKKATDDDDKKKTEQQSVNNKDGEDKEGYEVVPSPEKIVSAPADSLTFPFLDGEDDITLKHVEKVVQSKNFARNIILIPARVPVIKLQDTISNLNVTLNLNQEVSIRNTQLIRDYSKMDWRFPQLAMVVKQWARENRISSAVDKSISPYSWTLMVIHYLQVVEPPVLPCLQKMVPQRYEDRQNIEEEINQWRQQPVRWQSKNQNTLKQLMKGLFRYFGYVFDYEKNIISVREGKVLDRVYCRTTNTTTNASTNTTTNTSSTLDDTTNNNSNGAIQWNSLMCVEEPFTRTNTTRSVHDLETFKRIKELLRMSSNALKGNRISLFNIIVDDLDFPIKY